MNYNYCIRLLKFYNKNLFMNSSFSFRNLDVHWSEPSVPAIKFKTNCKPKAKLRISFLNSSVTNTSRQINPSGLNPSLNFYRNYLKGKEGATHRRKRSRLCRRRLRTHWTTNHRIPDKKEEVLVSHRHPESPISSSTIPYNKPPEFSEDIILHWYDTQKNKA